MAEITIKGAAKVVKFYNVTRLEIEGLEIDEFDLESREDVRELFETVNDFVETGEADAFEPPMELRGVDPEECAIRVAEHTLYSDEVVLANENIVSLVESIQDAEEGEVFYVRSFEGEGVWNFESEGDIDEPKTLQLGYVDCSILFDQYDVLREGYLDTICDTILPEHISYKNQRIELSEFLFNPVQVYGQLYVVKKDPIEEVNILQKVDFGGRMLVGADFDVDDFEAN